MIDTNKEIRRAVDTGKVLFGSEQSEKSILKGEAQLVIIADNTPIGIKEKIKSLAKVANTAVYDFSETSIKLGSLCGKPFSVSVMSVIDAGKSKVTEISQ